MIQSIVTATNTVLQSLGHNTPAANSIVNRFAGTRLLRAMPFLNIRGSSAQAKQSLAVQSRSVVTKSVAAQLNKTPTAHLIQSNFKFRNTEHAASYIRALQKNVVANASSNSANALSLATIKNPAADDIEKLVQEHGPATLTLYGLHTGQSYGPPEARTVLVTGTFRGDDGTCYAVVVDSDHFAKNPVKEFAEHYAVQNGKALHELDAHDYSNIDRQLAQTAGSPVFSQSMYRLINLDRSIETHHANMTRHASYISGMQRDLKKEGLDYALEDYEMPPSELNYPQHAVADAGMPSEVAKALSALVKTDPATVEPFIPPSGPAVTADLFLQTPDVAKVFNAPSVAAKWTPLKNLDELKAVFEAETTFREALGTPEGHRWAEQLLAAINAKEIPKGDKGIELIMRYKITYGTIAHTSLATLWRDVKGELQMGLVHQESIPINKKDWEGRVYTTYDTTQDYPGGHAPVWESIKLAGLPDINVRTTKYPDKIKGIGNALSGAEKAYPYGGTESWHGSTGRFPADRPFYTCFNVTLDTHRMMAGQYPVYKGLYPQIFKELGSTLWNTNYSSIENIKVGGKKYPMDAIMQLPFEIAAQMFNFAGSWWGDDKSWNVSSPREIKGGNIPLTPGKENTLPMEAFPPDFHGAIFINPRNLKTADDHPVARGVFYARGEIEGMKSAPEKPGKLTFYASVVRKSDA